MSVERAVGQFGWCHSLSCPRCVRVCMSVSMRSTGTRATAWQQRASFRLCLRHWMTSDGWALPQHTREQELLYTRTHTHTKRNANRNNMQKNTSKGDRWNLCWQPNLKLQLWKIQSDVSLCPSVGEPQDTFSKNPSPTLQTPTPTSSLPQFPPFSYSDLKYLQVKEQGLEAAWLFKSTKAWARSRELFCNQITEESTLFPWAPPP